MLRNWVIVYLGNFIGSVATAVLVLLGSQYMIKSFAAPEFWAKIGKTAADYAALNWGNFLVANLIPVTIGNIIGGAGLVGLVYWFAFLRTRRS